MKTDIHVVTGGCFGSEGKGAVAAWLTERCARQPIAPMVIRVAGPNAGHTAYDRDGNRFALRQIPVGMVSHPDVVGSIAPGSEVDLEVLFGEIDLLESYGHKVTDRLTIDPSATLLTREHRWRESDSDLVGRTGSTAKGVGAARIDRLMRTARTMGDVVAGEADVPVPYVERLHELDVVDTRGYQTQLDHGGAIIIEGTQGYGLGLHTPYYPQTTSQDCRAIDFLAQAGISPWHARVRDLHVWVVARVFPIRVAGNSGPLRGETSWAALNLPEERTTVTQKVRRVGAWDPDLVKAAVAANGGRESEKVHIALTMADHRFPELEGLDGHFESVDWAEVPEASAFLESVDDIAPVWYIGTGPNTRLWV